MLHESEGWYTHCMNAILAQVCFVVEVRRSVYASGYFGLSLRVVSFAVQPDGALAKTGGNARE